MSSATFKRTTGSAVGSFTGASYTAMLREEREGVVIRLTKKQVAVRVGLVGVGLLLIGGVGIALVALQGSGEGDPYKTTSVTNFGEDTTTVQPQEESQEGQEATTQQESIDPTTLATVAIEPMALSVSYVKGIGGFTYQVLRSPSGTPYVSFMNEALIGTKCTDDEGTFAAIIEGPSEAEQETLDATTVVSGTTYGLSLSADTCTSDPALLSEYQDAFLTPFSLLKTL